MKWNLLVGSLVLTMGLCTQSFGHGLLDRMLGANGCGCASSKCCDPDPGCGCDPKCGPVDPGCGCEVKCGAVDPGCGCEPSCYADPGCCGNKGRCCRRTLLDHLHDKLCCKRRGCGGCCDNGPKCGAVDPGCGCDPGCGAEPACCDPCGAAKCGADNGCGCDNGCRRRCCKPSLRDHLSRLFPCHRCKRCCGNGCTSGCADGCGCGSAPGVMKEAPAASDDDIPPAPMVDPSAFLPSARVIKASAAR